MTIYEAQELNKKTAELEEAVQAQSDAIADLQSALEKYLEFISDMMIDYEKQVEELKG